MISCFCIVAIIKMFGPLNIDFFCYDYFQSTLDESGLRADTDREPFFFFYGRKVSVLPCTFSFSGGTNIRVLKCSLIHKPLRHHL